MDGLPINVDSFEWHAGANARRKCSMVEKKPSRAFPLHFLPFLSSECIYSSVFFSFPLSIYPYLRLPWASALVAKCLRAPIHAGVCVICCPAWCTGATCAVNAASNRSIIFYYITRRRLRQPWLGGGHFTC